MRDVIQGNTASAVEGQVLGRAKHAQSAPSNLRVAWEIAHFAIAVILATSERVVAGPTLGGASSAKWADTSQHAVQNLARLALLAPQVPIGMHVLKGAQEIVLPVDDVMQGITEWAVKVPILDGANSVRSAATSWRADPRNAQHVRSALQGNIATAVEGQVALGYAYSASTRLSRNLLVRSPVQLVLGALWDSIEMVVAMEMQAPAPIAPVVKQGCILLAVDCSAEAPAYCVRVPHSSHQVEHRIASAVQLVPRVSIALAAAARVEALARGAPLAHTNRASVRDHACSAHVMQAKPRSSAQVQAVERAGRVRLTRLRKLVVQNSAPAVQSAESMTRFESVAAVLIAVRAGLGSLHLSLQLS